MTIWPAVCIVLLARYFTNCQYDTAKFMLINPAKRLFGEHFNLRADIRADIRHNIKMADVENIFVAFRRDFVEIV